MPKARTALDTPNARLSVPRKTLSDQKKLHIVKLETGLALGYRRGKHGGTWIARRREEDGSYGFERLGLADDAGVSNGLSWTQAQAKAREWHTRRDAEDAGEVVAGSYTVEKAVTDYIKNLETEKRKPLPLMWTAFNAHIQPTLGRIELSELKHGHLKKWRNAVATAAPRIRTGHVKEKVWVVNKRTGRGQYRERSTTVKMEQVYRTIDTADPEALRKRQATANRIVGILKAALNFAHTEGRVSSKGAWERIKPFKNVDAPKIRFLSMQEVAAFVPACVDEDFRKLSQGALLTGARYSELSRLIAEDFNPHNGRLHIAKSKNGEPRDIDLNEEAVAFFVGLTEGLAPNQRIFLRSNGKTWKTSEQRRPMVAACKVAGIKGASFHILRHTYASHAAMNGMPIEVLAQQLGHKDTRITTRHYAHLCPNYKKRIVLENAPTFGFKPVPEPPAPLVMPEYPPLPANVRTGKLLAMAGR